MIREHFHKNTAAVLENDARGETAVAFSALKDVVERVAKRRSEVTSCKARVYAVGNSVRVDVRAVTPIEVSLIEITHALESMIEEALLALCGTEIAVVNVSVDQTEAPKKA